MLGFNVPDTDEGIPSVPQHIMIADEAAFARSHHAAASTAAGTGAQREPAISEAGFRSVAEVATKPLAEFIPGQEPLQEDGSRKAKFTPESEPFDPGKLPTRTLSRGADQYLDTKWRVLWFREKHPYGQIISHAIEVTKDFAFFSATVYWPDDDGQMYACTAHGSETPGDFRDYIEKAETKAIGRALALAGFGAQFLPEDTQVVDAPVESRKPPQSDAKSAKVATPQKGDSDALRAAISVLQKQLVEQVRRIGASPSRMQAISEEVTGKRDAGKLQIADLQHLIATLADQRDNSFDPNEVYVPGSDD